MKNLFNGWEIRTVRFSGQSGVSVFAVNTKYGIEIKITHPRINVFGYVTNGCELGITGVLRTDNYDEQNEVLREIIDEHLAHYEGSVNHLTIRHYLKHIYNGKMIMSKTKGKTKKETDAINVVLGIIDEQYQNICRYRKTELEEERIFKTPQNT